jgi:hypothetical protein
VSSVAHLLDVEQGCINPGRKFARVTEICTASPNICGPQFGTGGHGGTVVKVLRYKSEGRWFDSRWCYCNFSFT